MRFIVCMCVCVEVWRCDMCVCVCVCVCVSKAHWTSWGPVTRETPKSSRLVVCCCIMWLRVQLGWGTVKYRKCPNRFVGLKLNSCTVDVFCVLKSNTDVSSVISGKPKVALRHAGKPQYKVYLPTLDREPFTSREVHLGCPIHDIRLFSDIWGLISGGEKDTFFFSFV